MAKGKRSKVFLVSVMRGEAAQRTYAVVSPTAAHALEAVSALCPAGCAPSFVGGLSRDTARALKLKPGEVRAI